VTIIRKEKLDDLIEFFNKLFNCDKLKEHSRIINEKCEYFKVLPKIFKNEIRVWLVKNTDDISKAFIEEVKEYILTIKFSKKKIKRLIKLISSIEKNKDINQINIKYEKYLETIRKEEDEKMLIFLDQQKNKSNKKLIKPRSNNKKISRDSKESEESEENHDSITKLSSKAIIGGHSS